MPATRFTGGRLLGLTGMTATLAGATLVGLLHRWEPSVDPVRRTISEYALRDHAWVFNTAVLFVVAGSIATALALARAGLLPPASLASAALAVWCAGLAGVVVFPKHNWAVGPSMSGEVHRGLSLAAFVSLPVAAILVGWAGRRSGWGRSAVLLGLVSLLAFAPIPIAYLAEPYTGVRWWRAIPLGLVERGLALSEVVAVLVLALWAAAAGPSPQRRGPTRGVGETRGQVDQLQPTGPSGDSWMNRRALIGGSPKSRESPSRHSRYRNAWATV